MKYWIRVSLQIILLWLIYELGNFIAVLTRLPVSGNVLGVILLFILLLTGIIPLKIIEDGADLLLKHLSFFFIPIAVGLMEWGNLLKTNGLQLLAVILLGTIICILVTGSLARILTKFSIKEQEK